MAELVAFKPSTEDEEKKRNGEPGVSGSKSPASNGVVLEAEEEAKNKDKKKKEPPPPTVGFCEIFRFADCLDRFLMILGAIFALCHGAALPGMIIVFGDMTDAMVNSGVYVQFLANATVQAFLASKNLTTGDVRNDPTLLATLCPELAVYANDSNICTSITSSLTSSITDKMTTFAIYYIIIGCCVIVVGYVQVAFWMTAAERQSHRIRMNFFSSVIHQEIGWFDTHEVGELNTRLADDIGKIHDGIGDKVGSCIQWTAAFIAGFTVGFIYGWKLTLVILAISPLLAIAASLMGKLASSMTNKELEAYAKAGAVAEEAISSIRTVVAFGGQQKESVRYESNLGDARDFGIKKAFTSGLSMGFVWLVIFLAYALGFWYGAKLVRDEPNNYSVGKMLVVFFSVLIGAFSLGNASPGFQSLATARGAAYTIYQLIDHRSRIDASSKGGKKPETLTGNISFRNIHFTYPSREEVKILDSLSFDVNQGQTVALVGHSGCGKSTTVQLLQRFYDPDEGEILLDGMNIKELNIEWLRKHIGLVSQEPVLFGQSIEENIRFGRDGVTLEEIKEAAIMANAHDFIMNLPDKYKTLVGERGAQLSGGQKQRVAIARALVRNPRILLLDEATSALDTESEAVVQDALDKARQGRTTLIIAHRLSTIKTADIIVGIDNGKVMEKGTHNELMSKDGIYHKLVTNQTRGKTKEEESAAEEETEEEEEEIEAIARVGSNRESKKQLKRALSDGDKKVARMRSISESEDKKEKKKEEENQKKGSFKRMMQLNAPEWPYILLGCFAAILNGGVQPAFAIIFSEVLGAFSASNSEMESKVNMMCLILVGLGIVSCVAMFLQSYMFGKAGENLTVRLRSLSFKAILRQEIAYFDDHNNNTGSLTTRLATDASLVQGATGIRLGTVVQNIANMGTAVVISFIYGWKMTLVIFAFLPFIMIAGAIEMKILAGVAGKNKEALEGAGKLAVEALSNVRTVASLSKEVTFVKLYEEQLLGPYKVALGKAHLVGAAFGFSQAIIFFAYAASFWFGAYMIKTGEMDYIAVFRVFGVIVFGAMAIGQASAFAPDASKAAVSAGRIFDLLDRQPAIDSDDPSGDQLPEGSFEANVEFKSVKFRYPTRPEVQVLTGLNVSVRPGCTLALVGSSGCGKSTTVQLLERFYDPEDGAVMMAGRELRNLNLSWLRKQMGIVSQEPILFDMSIAENIAYGDNSRVVGMDEIIEAARSANIHTFISSLPDGYETNVGNKGTQLSGGQKQRVAIARALVRNPKILLLDEATSALDTESEKVVQEALDKAREGRTSIVIAHRLSTVQNADCIVVIRNGQVVEEGTHSALVNKQGFYYKLIKAQQKQK